MSSIRRALAPPLVLALTLALVAVAPSVASAQEEPPSQVRVVHGVPDLVVDVYVDGELTLPEFQPGDVVGPIDLPAGTYTIDIRATGDPPTSPPAITGSASVSSGMSYSLVAHLDAAGTPTLSAFVDDFSQVTIGNGRLVVRHTAAAPAVDVLADGAVLVPGLANPNGAATEVLAGNYAVTLNAAGTASQAFDAGIVAVAADTVTTVYAIGDLAGNTFGLVVDVVDQPAPGARVGLVNPGTGLWAPPGLDPFFYGVPGDVPFLGDWDGDGIATPGLYRPSEGFAYIRNSNTFGVADDQWFMGIPGDIPLAGDWDGDGVDTFGVYRPSEGQVYLRNSNSTGVADLAYFFGNPGDIPFAGDFDGDGIDTVGLFRTSTGLVYFRNSQTTGPADAEFFFGAPGDSFLAGDWDGDGTDTVGVIRGASPGTFFFRNSNTQGFADGEIPVAEAGWPPIVRVPEGELMSMVADFMRGSLEVPAGSGDDNGLGIAFVDYDPAIPAEVCFFIQISGVEAPVAAHIHAGARGVNGPVVVDFDIASNPFVEDEINPFFHQAEGCVEVSAATMSQVFADPAAHYVNVHSTGFPAGAIRNQLLDITNIPGPPPPTAEAGLFGQNEVPGPGDDDAFGQATLRTGVDEQALFIAPETGEWCYHIVVLDGGVPTAAHIHEGAAGVAGDVVIDLDLDRWGIWWDEFDDSWNADGCVPVAAEVGDAILANPSGYYANVHSAEFPAGVVRGQLGPPGTVLGAELTGDAEVPGPGDADGGGFAVLPLAESVSKICFLIDVSDIGTPTAAHIHDGDPDEAGPVVVDFDIASNPFVPSGVPIFDLFARQCVDVDAGLLASIKADPGAFYVNVHNDEYPAGALRGQIFPLG